MQRYICIHGHFYQPPRENPWLEAIEVQDSAYPYHDWNERITAECYEPNSASRILDEQNRIVRIVNNYADISFNIGPTLLSWMEKHAPEAYRRILQADRDSRRQFSGHGSALAQVYNHMIMPLANRRDKVTQVKWGIRDFQRRFGRMPEGMWLAETAADTETLEVLAEHAIQFTILSPYQAHQVRRYRGRTWNDVSGGKIDPTKGYLVRLPSNRKLTVFFYDGPISQAVAFEGLLVRGEHLANRLMGAFSDHRDWNQLVHIATDGESYGHHHRHGDMALAYALHHIRQHQGARITNYGEYLERNPAVDEVRIYENSSWSCCHGVARWCSDCGCSTGGHPDWNQQWRGPLRAALDWLRDQIAPRFEEMGGRMLKDPWEARDGYIDVVLDRSPESVDRFLRRYGSHKLGHSLVPHVLMLLEMQRQCLLMYTSCGWFFDELSGLETVQVLHYAGRAIQLAEYLFEVPLEEPFCRMLSAAKSNLPEHGDGEAIYRKWVKPAVVELEDVGAHFAVSSLFEQYQQRNKIFAYAAEVESFQLKQTGHTKLAVGNARITSQITHQSADFSFGVIHWGGHNLHGGIRRFPGPEEHDRFVQQVLDLFARADYTTIVGVLEREFHASTYSLRSLFRDEQRKILNRIVDAQPAEQAYRELYQDAAPLLHFLASLHAPRPRAFTIAAEYVLNLDLRRAITEGHDPGIIEQLLGEARICGVQLDQDGLRYAIEQRILGASSLLHNGKPDTQRLESLAVLIAMARSLPFEVNLRPAQNAFYEMLNQRRQLRPAAPGADSQVAEPAVAPGEEPYQRLGELLGVRVET